MKKIDVLAFVLLFSCGYVAGQGPKSREEAKPASQPAQAAGAGAAASAMQNKPAIFRHEYKQVEADIKQLLSQFDNPALRKKYPSLNTSSRTVDCRNIDGCDKILTCKEVYGQCELPFFDMLAHVNYKKALGLSFEGEDSFESMNPASPANDLLAIAFDFLFRNSFFNNLPITKYVTICKELESLSTESFLSPKIREKIASIARNIKARLAPFWTLEIDLPDGYLKNTGLKAHPEFWHAWETVKTNADRLLLLEAVVASFMKIDRSASLGTLNEFKEFAAFIREQEKEYSMDAHAIKDILAPLNKFYGEDRF